MLGLLDPGVGLALVKSGLCVIQMILVGFAGEMLIAQKVARPSECCHGFTGSIICGYLYANSYVPHAISVS